MVTVTSYQVQREGISAIFKGLTPVLIRAFPANAVSPSPVALCYDYCSVCRHVFLAMN